jgi:hypothetical protein
MHTTRFQMMLFSIATFLMGMSLLYYAISSLFSVPVAIIGIFTLVLSFCLCYSWTHGNYESLP